MSAAAALSMPSPASVTHKPDLFRQGMRRLAGACTIITSVAPGQGRKGWAGLTATAVASVTAEPARLLVCVNRSTWAHGIIGQSRILGVNVLDDDALPLAQRFAGGVKPEEKFDQGGWLTATTGAPLLSSALVSFDCLVSEVIEASTHDIFICDVLGVLLREPGGDPLIYFDGAFLCERQTQ
ncbi:flavin reductase family protein [Sphingobium estronivorans]|uniref:flavin reductase family protein n=1 Tax=Sphingobium estronivorans TaxID=1577690 RepID=UPI0012392DD8|nr:flavin reductase family protein [Sphingobium estronivorans]